MDRLEEIFTMQKALNMDIRARRNLQGISHEEWVQKQALALYVEMGTSRTAAQPYLRPALKANKAHFLQSLSS